MSKKLNEINEIAKKALEWIPTKFEEIEGVEVEYIGDDKGGFSRPSTWQERELRSVLEDVLRLSAEKEVDWLSQSLNEGDGVYRP